MEPTDHQEFSGGGVMAGKGGFGFRIREQREKHRRQS